MRLRLADERSVRAVYGTLWRFFDRRRITVKKDRHVSEPERDDVRAAREVWFEGQPDLDPTRLIFIDETGLNTKMARLRGRCPKGERLFASIPHGHSLPGSGLPASRERGTPRPLSPGCV